MAVRSLDFESLQLTLGCSLFIWDILPKPDKVIRSDTENISYRRHWPSRSSCQWCLDQCCYTKYMLFLWKTLRIPWNEARGYTCVLLMTVGNVKCVLGHSRFHQKVKMRERSILWEKESYVSLVDKEVHANRHKMNLPFQGSPEPCKFLRVMKLDYWPLVGVGAVMSWVSLFPRTWFLEALGSW